MPRRRKRTREVMVVPIREEAFAAARKIRVYATPIERGTSDCKYIAFYRGSPTSAITHYAPVELISKNKTFKEIFPQGSQAVAREDKPLKVYHLGDLVELERRVKKGMNHPISTPRYSKLDTIRAARYLDEVWEPEPGTKAAEAVEAARAAGKPSRGKDEPKERKSGERRGRKDAKGGRGGSSKAERGRAEEAKKEEAPKRRKRKSSRSKKGAEPEEMSGGATGSMPKVHYIVDGSNVALEARSFKEGGRLRQIELVKDKLSQERGAAVTVIIDANLRHHIDRKDDLERMINEREVLQAPAQTDADEFILLTAEIHRTRGENVVIISNDMYKDYIKKYKPRFNWVQKSQRQFMFVLSPDGSKALEAIISMG